MHVKVVRGGCLLALIGASAAGCGASSDAPPSTPEPHEHVLAVIDVPAVAPPASAPAPSVSARESTGAPGPSVAPSAAPPAPSASGSFFEVVPTVSPSASASAAGPPAVLDTKTAAEIIATMRPAFQACLRAQLDVTPGVSGTMSLDVDLKADGTIQRISARDTKSLPKPLIHCVVGVVQATTFPRTVNGKSTILTIPINFTH